MNFLSISEITEKKFLVIWYVSENTVMSLMTEVEPNPPAPFPTREGGARHLFSALLPSPPRGGAGGGVSLRCVGRRGKCAIGFWSLAVFSW